MQLASLGVTLGIAVVGGLITGYIIHIDCIFNILKDTELFEDSLFFAGLVDDEEVTEESTVSSSINVASVDQPSKIKIPLTLGCRFSCSISDRSCAERHF